MPDELNEDDLGEISKGGVSSKDAKCGTCGDLRVVATSWPSGYPHATPCPECRPGELCGCGLPEGECPSRDAIIAWGAARTLGPVKLEDGVG